MRDLDQYDDAPIVRRSTHRRHADDFAALVRAVAVRAIILLVLIAGLVYMLWSMNAQPNIPVSPQDIGNIQKNREIIHRDAEKAAKVLGADIDEEAYTLKLVEKRQMDPYFPLKKQDRLLIHKYWGAITDGLTHREIDRLLAILDMRYDDEGNVVDIPLEERNEAQKEARLQEGINRNATMAVDIFLDAARNTQADRLNAEVRRENARRNANAENKQLREAVQKDLEADISRFLSPEDTPDGIQDGTSDGVSDGAQEDTPEPYFTEEHTDSIYNGDYIENQPLPGETRKRTNKTENAEDGEEAVYGEDMPTSKDLDLP